MGSKQTLGSAAVPIEPLLRTWVEDDAVSRLWSKDHTLWTEEPKPEITDRLGWLTLPNTMKDLVDDLETFAAEVAGAGFRHVVLLGMGGSSLAPEVFQRTFGNRAGHPELRVLDSTHPSAVLGVEAAIDLERTLFLVSSKSGTTIEPMSFLAYFWDRVSQISESPGDRFVAITDPGSSLGDLGRDRGFLRVFEAIPDVGGRYSALTHFGLVPAALIGVDIRAVLASAASIAERTRIGSAADPDGPVALGAALGALAAAGRDKVTFVMSPELEAVPAWVEQLIAESIGKDGVGIVPIADEPLGPPEVYRDDRFFIALTLADDVDEHRDAALETLEAAGHPVARIVVDELTDLGAEMFRAEVATAMAGAVLGIHPFNQPDVQRAKALASQAMDGSLETGSIPETPADDRAALGSAVADFLGSIRVGDYIGLQAFIAPAPEAEAGLHRIAGIIRDRLQTATTVGFGPRFLHSTGQLHKGGADNGAFIQIVDHAAPAVPVPEADHTFAKLIAGQADGDFQALKDAGRRVIRVCLGDDTAGGLATLETVVGE